MVNQSVSQSAPLVSHLDHVVSQSISQSDPVVSHLNHVVNQSVSHQSVSQSDHVVSQSHNVVSQSDHVVRQSDHVFRLSDHVVSQLAPVTWPVTSRHSHRRRPFRLSFTGRFVPQVVHRINERTVSVLQGSVH